MTLIERLRRRVDGFPQTGTGWVNAAGEGAIKMNPAPQVLVNPDGPEAAAELEANAAEIGRLREALKEARIVLMAHGFGAHSVTISQIDAALNKQESGNV